MPQSSLSTWLQKPKEPLRPITPTTPNLAPTEPSSAAQISPATPLPTASIHTRMTFPPLPAASDPPSIPSPIRTDHKRHTTQDQEQEIEDTTMTEVTQSLDTSQLSSPTAPVGLGTFHLRALPPPVTICPLTPDAVEAFRRLNALLLPIPYPQSFYDEIFSDPVSGNITLMAYWDPSASNSTSTPNQSSPHPHTSTNIQERPAPNSTLVAAFRARIYPHPLNPSSLNPLNTPLNASEPPPLPTLYISTLTVHPSYRSYGLATHLFHTILGRAIRDYGVTSATAHVWEANEEGREWYLKRGFREEGRVEGYYRRLRPGGAVLVRRAVSVSDGLL